MDRGIGPINLNGLQGKIKKAKFLLDGSEVKLERPWNAGEYPYDAFIEFSTSALPDENDTVVEIELF